MSDEMNEGRDILASNVSGVLVVDKPVGLSSHDVVQIIRNGTKIRRAGHTGTLDPRASGVLVVLLGPAVRLSEYVSASEKRYQAVIELGVTTDTYDLEGRVTRRSPVDISYEEFEQVLQSFVGEFEQKPPAYSAIKVKGEKAYEIARRGEEVELEPRMIQVRELELLDWDPPEAVVDIQCSSGTYVRSLAYDLGEKLGCGATLTGLRRTKNGRFGLRDAVSLRKLQEAFANGDWYQYLIPAAEALGDWYTVELSVEQVDEVRHGHRVPALEEVEPGKWARAVSQEGELVALMEYDSAAHEWQPRKVFFL
ncbi:MAG TPA: tRNA pseudouridine(55) synthase TruB [Anaerolineaceae bacterium]|jgi:tRNA pseudouridine55 synthase|nr:tRNA pseudouridine(55) synthase TruB [Anaerolineales bacterium]HOG58048.1 tRNA pseudouridine(55) synthase TruB [Anaerolineaceae bacterium]HOR84288.1 tRNA pseudouridine(55) synthase TruB [Anaerolineaceae bacterium]HOT53637.1 tRNA pseudouridine(55) synthase TruB [Anaerolineaceae bacterium]HPL42584.1 tRNA pseudouridine(55) synthase TruB [Anaerolineaceae bacterium]